MTTALLWVVSRQCKSWDIFYHKDCVLFSSLAKIVIITESERRGPIWIIYALVFCANCANHQDHSIWFKSQNPTRLLVCNQCGKSGSGKGLIVASALIQKTSKMTGQTEEELQQYWSTRIHSSIHLCSIQLTLQLTRVAVPKEPKAQRKGRRPISSCSLMNTEFKICFFIWQDIENKICEWMLKPAARALPRSKWIHKNSRQFLFLAATLHSLPPGMEGWIKFMLMQLLQNCVVPKGGRFL